MMEQGRTVQSYPAYPGLDTLSDLVTGGFSVTIASDVFQHPVLGERILVLKSAQETGGDSLHLELHLAPHQSISLEHVHPVQKERLTVLSGVMHVHMNGAMSTVRPGQKLEIPPGAPHMCWNANTNQAVAHVEFRPALRMEGYLETFFALAQAGQVSRKTGLPGIVRRAVLLNEYRNEIRLVGMAEPVQSCLFALLAAIGKLLGYHRALQRLSYA
jgi:mannose-6-phosphate isomerase-like protein (cupin superfamily)